MENFQFQVEDEIFSIPKNRLVKYNCSFLYIAATTNIGNNDKLDIIPINSISKQEFLIIYNFLLYKRVNSIDDLPILDYLNINCREEYAIIYLVEQYFRDHLYDKNLERNEFIEPFYNLVKLDQDLFNSLNHSKNDRDSFLFTHVMRPKLLSIESIQERIDEMNFLTSIDNILIAGGKAFHCLYDTFVDDVDIFLFGLSEEQAVAKIEEIYNAITKYVRENYKYTDEIPAFGEQACKDPPLIRTKNAITINTYSHRKFVTDPPFEKQYKYQIILRLYKTPSEILHSFDIDSCCIGIYKNDIYMTDRCKLSLFQGYNRVNFSRLSPSYEYRLVKYAMRGIRIRITDRKIEKSLINREKLIDFYEKHCDSANEYMGNRKKKFLYERYSNVLRELHGLDILLYLEHYHITKNLGNRNSKFATESLNKLGLEISDYDDFYKSHKQYQTTITNLFYHLIDTSEKYRENSRNYLPIIKKFYEKTENLYEYSHGYFDTIFRNVMDDSRIDNINKLRENLLETVKILKDLRENPNIVLCLDRNLIKMLNIENVYKSTDCGAMGVYPQFVPVSMSDRERDENTQFPLEAINVLINLFPIEQENETDDENISDNENDESDQGDDNVSEENLEIAEENEQDIISEEIESESLDESFIEDSNDIDLNNKYEKCMDACSNSLKCKTFDFFQTSHLDILLKIPKNVYLAMECVKRWDIPRKITFKTIAPGEQATSTFNILVLENTDNWFRGQFYNT